MRRISNGMHVMQVLITDQVYMMQVQIRHVTISALCCWCCHHLPSKQHRFVSPFSCVQELSCVWSLNIQASLQACFQALGLVWLFSVCWFSSDCLLTFLMHPKHLGEESIMLLPVNHCSTSCRASCSLSSSFALVSDAAVPVICCHCKSS